MAQTPSQTKKKQAPAKEKKVRAQYTAADRKMLAARVFAGMRSGLSALKACAKIRLPQSCLNRWLEDDAEMAAEYTRARADLMEFIADEMMGIADDPVSVTANGTTDAGAVHKQRLQVDTRKWLLSKLAPKRYGDRIAVAGADGEPLNVNQTFDVSGLPTDVLAQILAAKDAANRR